MNPSDPAWPLHPANPASPLFVNADAVGGEGWLPTFIAILLFVLALWVFVESEIADRVRRRLREREK